MGLSLVLNAQTVTIGTQVWMTKNLDVAKFRNGDPIPEAKTDEEWEKAGENKQPAWCNYDNNPDNGTKYGKLYNWYAVNDPRGLAPEGYHVPTDAEWTILTTFLGGESVAGGKMKSSGTQYWYRPNQDATNASKFSGLPGGIRGYGGSFYYFGDFGYWWSSSEDDSFDAWLRFLSYYYGYVARILNDKVDGFSVRCLRD